MLERLIASEWTIQDESAVPLTLSATTSAVPGPTVVITPLPSTTTIPVSVEYHS